MNENQFFNQNNGVNDENNANLVNMNYQTVNNEVKPPKKSKLPIFLLLLIVVIGLGIGGYFVYSKVFNKNSNDGTQSNTNVENSSGVIGDYPLLYVNKDGDLKLLAANVSDEEKAVTLVRDEGSSAYPEYANTTNRYILFVKYEALYLYDSKSKDKTRKVKGDVGEYGFTPNDKYVVFTIKDIGTDIYSYDYKNKPVKVESGVSSLVDVLDNYVVYKKDDILYVRDIEAKKDKVKITSAETKNVRVSKDGKRVIYLTKDGDLHIYLLDSKEDTKIASNVRNYYNNETGIKFFYIDNDSSANVYYYDGESVTKFASDVNIVEDYDVDAQKLLYTEKDGDKETLYFKKGTNDKILVEDGVGSANFGTNDDIYYSSDASNKFVLKYAKINGNKIDGRTILSDDVETIRIVKDGILFVDYVDKNNVGTLYVAKNGIKEKIDENVYVSSLRVGNNGDKYYYYKNYSERAGDFYVSDGGKGKVIDTDVHQFVVINDNLIFYLRDYSKSGKGDLYKSTGSKGKKLAEDIVSLKSTPNYYDPSKK